MEGTQAPEQIIINGREYSSEDATQLIELGNKWKETESKLNTSLDKVYPEYTKATQQNKDYQRQLAERDAELEKYRAQQAETLKAQTPNEIKDARRAARELGLADEDYLKEKGYMTRDEMDMYYTEKQTLQRQADSILEQTKALEKKIDGSDGRVPFDQKSVLAYQNVYGIADAMDAYEQMNERANAKWKAQQIEQEQRPGLTTLKPGGNKEPIAPKYTNANIGNAIGEWLNGIQE